ncbi:MFS transporter [Actinoplanes sp. NPDC023714]|uniref:MFS transporter n=1 Tax=Actinoplanes sp. NPDC023714 TaxID=3154322 RepID=UPI0033EC44E0
MSTVIEGRATRNRWAVLVLLGVTVFVAITFETLPIGLLGSIAGDLGTTDQGAGLLISVYAVVVVVGAIPLSALVARFDARRTLLVVLGIFAVSTLLMALAPALPVALVARLLGGLGHAVLFTCVYRVALSVLPPDRTGIAAGVVSAGNATALSLGQPAATALGVATVWSVPFALIAAIFTTLAVLTVVLVREPSPTTTAQATLRAAWRPPLIRVAATITVLVLGHFVTYSYVEPLLRAAGVSDQGVSAVLLGYGAACVVGLLVISPFSDRRPALAVKIVTALVLLAFLALWLGRTHAGLIVAAVILWGLSFGAVPVLVQVLSFRASAEAPDAAPPVVNTAFNIGITLGAVVGGQMLRFIEPGSLPLASAVLVVVVLAAILQPRWLPRDDVRAPRESAAAG